MTTKEIRSRSMLETRRAAAVSFAPASFDPQTGTATAVIATEALVSMGRRFERLVLTPDSVNIAESVVVLDSHRQTSIADIKGRASKFRFVNGALLAELHITDEMAREAVALGTVTAVSIGYRILSFKDVPDSRTGLVVRTVTKLEIVEVSLVAVPADANATIRSYPVEDETIDTPAGTEIISEAPIVTREQAVASARLYNVANPDQFVADVTTAGLSLLETRSLALQRQQERANPVSTIRVGLSGDDPVIQRGFQAEALAASYLGTEPSEGARQYMGLGTRMHDHMRVALTRSGERNVNTMGVETLVTRSVGLGQNTTSDFPLILDTGGNHIVQAAYTEMRTPLTRIGRQVNIPDFGR